MSKLILASKSPRRKELLMKLGIPFICEPAVSEEHVPEKTPVRDTAELLSRKKAAEVYEKHAGEEVTVIGSDTVVIIDDEILGKPHTEEEAARMLRKLSGRTHTVSTGVTILGRDREESFTSETAVTFYDLSEEEIREYIRTGEPMDKAGAYGIQGYGALFVKEIRGDYSTVVGFPIAEIYRRLR